MTVPFLGLLVGYTERTDDLNGHAMTTMDGHIVQDDWAYPCRLEPVKVRTMSACTTIEDPVSDSVISGELESEMNQNLDSLKNILLSTNCVLD